MDFILNIFDGMFSQDSSMIYYLAGGALLLVFLYLLLRKTKGKGKGALKSEAKTSEAKETNQEVVDKKVARLAAKAAKEAKKKAEKAAKLAQKHKGKLPPPVPEPKADLVPPPEPQQVPVEQAADPKAANAEISQKPLIAPLKELAAPMEPKPQSALGTFRAVQLKAAQTTLVVPKTSSAPLPPKPPASSPAAKFQDLVPPAFPHAPAHVPPAHVPPAPVHVPPAPAPVPPAPAPLQKAPVPENPTVPDKPAAPKAANTHIGARIGSGIKSAPSQTSLPEISVAVEQEQFEPLDFPGPGQNSAASEESVPPEPSKTPPDLPPPAPVVEEIMELEVEDLQSEILKEAEPIKSEQPISEQSTSEQSTSEQSTSEQSTSEQSTSEQSISKQSISEEPISKQSISEEPISEQSISEQPRKDEENKGLAADIPVLKPMTVLEGRGGVLKASQTQMSTPIRIEQTQMPRPKESVPEVSKASGETSKEPLTIQELNVTYEKMTFLNPIEIVYYKLLRAAFTQYLIFPKVVSKAAVKVISNNQEHLKMAENVLVGTSISFVICDVKLNIKAIVEVVDESQGPSNKDKARDYIFKKAGCVMLRFYSGDTPPDVSTLRRFLLD
jgi:hypothetical protein